MYNFPKNGKFQIPKNLKEIINTTSSRYYDTYELVKLDFREKIEKDSKNNIHFYDIPQIETSTKKSPTTYSKFKSIHRFREGPEKITKVSAKGKVFPQISRSFENSLKLEIKKEKKNLMSLSEV